MEGRYYIKSNTLTVYAIQVFGHAIDKTPIEIEDALSPHHQQLTDLYALLKDYIRIFRERNLELHQLKVDGITEASTTFGDIRKSAKNNDSFYDELSNACLFGMIHQIPQLPSFGLTKDVDKELASLHDKLANALDKIPDLIWNVVNKNISSNDIESHIIDLCQALRETTSYKNKKINENDKTKNDALITQLDSFIKDTKNLINNLAIILKKRKDEDCLRAMGIGINENFNRYIRSLARHTFGEGQQDTKARDKKQAGIKLAIQTITKTKEEEDFYLKFIQTLYEFNLGVDGDLYASGISGEPPIDNRTLLENLDTFIANLNEVISNKINEPQAKNKKKKTAANVEELEELEDLKTTLKNLILLRHRIENEIMIFHTKGRSHTGHFGFKNLLLVSDKHGNLVQSDGIKLATERAHRQISQLAKVVAQKQSKHLTKKIKKPFTTTLFEKWKGLWTAQYTHEVHHVNNNVLDLHAYNQEIINEKNNTKITENVMGYLNTCYKHLSGNDDVEDRAKFFKSAIQKYRDNVFQHFPEAVRFLGQAEKNNSQKNNLMYLHTKFINMDIQRHYSAKLASIGLNIRNFFLPKSNDNNHDIHTQLQNILGRLESCSKIEGLRGEDGKLLKNEDGYLDILNDLNQLHYSLEGAFLSASHREMIQKIMIDIVEGHILNSDNKIRFPVKHKHLLATRSFISCIKTKENAFQIEKILHSLNNNIQRTKQNSINYDNLLLVSHIEQNSKFKDLLDTKKLDENDKKTTKLRRLKRFGEALSAELSSGIMAKCALASGFIIATNTARTAAL
ncbi:MAG: hypothetical protein JO149_08355, partial [Gammaproteobacteria bacterium]|nr:hypothetical protein [Gammaproteobacteria bacterium]